jgi:hypothetical protein
MMSPLLRHRLRAAALAAAFYAGRAGFAGEGPDAGLTAAERTAVVETVTRSSSLGASLAGSRYRVFAVGTAVTKVAGGVRREAHTLLYDYTNDKTYHVVNDITAGVPGAVIETSALDTQLPPHPEESAEARALVQALPQVQQLMRLPDVVLRDGFPVDGASPPCHEHRCLQIQVNQIPPGANGVFLLLVTVDVSARQVVEVREPKRPTSLAR